MQHLWKALAYLYPNAQPRKDYDIWDDGNGPYIAIWNLHQPQPTDAELTTAIAAYDAASATQQSEAAILRQQVINLAQSAVGVRVDQLTAAQVRALFAVILRKEGALSASGTVKPLAEWVKD